MSLILVKNATDSKVQELECTTAGLLKVDHVDVSSLATQATMSSMNGKITACDTSSIGGSVAVTGTVACSHAALPLPTGAATESSLATVAGCVTAGKLAVQSTAPVVSATSAYVFGTQGNPSAEISNIDATSTSVNVDAFHKVLVAGSTTKLDSELQLEVSSDNLDYFDLNNVNVMVDYQTGHFGVVIDAPFKHIRLKRLADASAAGSDSISCIISGK